MAGGGEGGLGGGRGDGGGGRGLGGGGLGGEGLGGGGLGGDGLGGMGEGGLGDGDRGGGGRGGGGLGLGDTTAAGRRGGKASDMRKLSTPRPPPLHQNWQSSRMCRNRLKCPSARAHPLAAAARLPLAAGARQGHRPSRPPG